MKRYSPPRINYEILDRELDDLRNELKVSSHNNRRLVRIMILESLRTYFLTVLQIRKLNELTENNANLLADCTELKEKLGKYDESMESIRSELIMLRERNLLYEGPDENIHMINSLEKCEEFISIFRVRLEKFLAQKERITKTQSEAQLNCIICRDRVKSVMFTPCHHLCVCNACFSNHQFSKCPICRTDVLQHFNVFL